MKTKMNLLFAALLLMVVFSCKNNKKTDENTSDLDSLKEVEKVVETEEVTSIVVPLEPKSGSNAKGEATFTQKYDSVVMVVSLTGLTPGEHAIHLHETADCSSDDAKSTGGHWNPTDQQHGKWGDEKGYHRGDIGNMTADEDGNATLTFATDEWAIGGDDDSKNIIGRGIIVHTGADDFTSQPTGDAGGRVACGEIK